MRMPIAAGLPERTANQNTRYGLSPSGPTAGNGQSNPRQRQDNQYHGSLVVGQRTLTPANYCRRRLAKSATAWRDLLSAADRAAWNSFAAITPIDEPPAGALFTNGFGMYMKFADVGGLGCGDFTELSQWPGLAQNLSPPTFANIPNTPTFTFTVVTGGNAASIGLVLAHSAGNNPGPFAAGVFYGTLPYSGRPNTRRNPLVHFTTQASSNPPGSTDYFWNLTAEWNLIFGGVQAGLKVTMGMRIGYGGHTPGISNLFTHELTVS